MKRVTVIVNEQRWEKYSMLVPDDYTEEEAREAYFTAEIYDWPHVEGQTTDTWLDEVTFTEEELPQEQIV